MLQMIIYNLHEKTEANHSKIAHEIELLPKACKLAESCWIVSSSDTCETLCDKLLKSLQPNDILVVSAIGSTYWYNVICGDEKLIDAFS
jgi:recombinational DNA repair protein RecR